MKLAGMVGALALVGSLFSPAKAEERPNVLIILVDDMRATEDFYSVMPSTMRLFRKRGTEFPNAVATTPLCCPSRASILTGQYSHNHGVLRNNLASMLDQAHTLQYELQNAGYHTAIAGKFLNKWTEAPSYFDKWAVLMGREDYSYYDAVWNVNGSRRRIPEYTTDYVARKGVNFLESFERKDRDPWFMQLSPYAPHEPATPEEKYASAPIPEWTMTPATMEADVSDKPPWSVTADKSAVRSFRRLQLRSLMSVDDLVKKVQVTLRDLNESQDTVIFFMSDNGFLLYEHRLSQKSQPYDESVEIPFYVKWPGVLEAGSDDRIVTNIDVAPTVYEAAGVEPAYTVDGRSILTSDRDHAYIEYPSNYHPWSSIWHPDWTYVRYEPFNEYDVFREYYGDPWQLENLLVDGLPLNDPDTTAWDAELDAARTCAGAACP
jgi:arylsulfatase A-like enzyme